MDQSPILTPASFPPQTRTAAAEASSLPAPPASPAPPAPPDSRGWRGALAGVFGRGTSTSPDSPVAPQQSSTDAAAKSPSNAAINPSAIFATGKPATNGEAIRQICELIRAPLAGLTGMTDLVAAGGLTPAQVQYMAVIRTSVAEALTTLEDVSELASEDQKFIEPLRRPFTAPQVLDPLALEFASQCSARQLKLNFKNNLPADARLEGDLTRITNLTRRILRIAVRHNEHTALELSLSASPRSLTTTATTPPAASSASHKLAGSVTAQITLGDFQMGLPTERADRILRGTPRSDELCAQDGQTGLTLRACRVTVTMLGGTIAIASAGNGLSRVLISIPIEMSISCHTVTAATTTSAASAAGKSATAAASIDGPALIDIEALTARCVNNKAVAAAVLESLARMLPEKLTGLREALETSDAEKARTIAHTIKGSAANAAVEAVRSKALQIELMAKAADLDGITNALPALEKIIARVLIEIPQARATLTSPSAKAAA